MMHLIKAYSKIKINDFVGEWLCARPIWNDLQKYRVHHVRHHAKTSTPDDPDLSLVSGFL